MQMRYIAVFRSRNQAFTFERNLNADGIPAVTVPTPDELQIGCGLSVRIEESALPGAKIILDRLGLSTFHGWYTYDKA
jgi:hypothetical protein